MKIRLLILLALVFSPLLIMADQMIIDHGDGNGGRIVVTSSEGLSYTISAIPETGYEFLFWEDGSTNASRTVLTSQAQDLRFRAVFGKSSDIHSAQGNTSATFKDKAVPSYWLTATPSAECTMFKSWNTGSTTNPLPYLESDGVRSPVYSSSMPDTLFMVTMNGEGGTVSGVKVKNSCADYLCTATPAAGYEFLYWEDESTNPSRTYTYTGGDVRLRAVFGKTSDLQQQGGSVTTALTDPVTPTYSMLATAGECASFVKWNNDVTTPQIAYQETEGTRTPVFSNKEMLYKKTDNEGGTIVPTQLVCGYTLTPQANPGFRFAYWEDGGTTAIRDVDFLEQAYTATFVDNSIVALRDGQTYTSIQSAIDANSEEEVIVLADAAEDLSISKPVTINAQGATLGSLSIENGGDLTLSSQMNISNLYLNATTGSSSQFRSPDQLDYQQAYFKLKLEKEKAVASPDLWYAFAVPFEVDVNNGIRRSSAPNTACVNFKDYLVWEYDGQMRADNKENGWVQMATGTLKPGQFYMIGIDGTENIWQFTKTAQSQLGGDADVQMYIFDSDKQNRGWNAMGNSTLTYINAETDNGVQIAQVYENGAATANYKVKNFTESSFVMASPFFVQTSDDDVLHLTATTSSNQGTPYAPVRRNALTNAYNKLSLLRNSEEQDVVFMYSGENATNDYEVGKDVIKMVGGETNAYLWIDAYGERLCAQDAPSVNDVTEYAISMYAPQAADYNLALKQTTDEVTLWYQGVQVWNFVLGGYAIQLPKGTTSGYSIRIGKNRTLPTGMNRVESKDAVVKYIQDGQLYIRSGNSTYNAQGVVVF